MSSPIATLVQECLSGFRSLLRDTQNDTETHDRLNDQLGRFRIWAGNVSAHTTGRRSLQYRLRDSSQLSDAVLKYLRQLHSEVVLGAGIFTGQARTNDGVGVSDSVSDDEHEDGEDDDFEDGDLELFESFSNENPVTMHLSAIEDIITCLLRISMALRNPARNNQIRYGDTVSTEHFKPHDIQHVRSKFPQLGETIAGRLGTAISRHRQYIKYREEHHLKLAEGINDEKDDEAEAIQEIQQQDNQTSAKLTSNLATTIATSVFVPHQQQAFDASDSDLESVGTATSYAETMTDDKQLRPPKLPETGADGQPFECPLCYSIITAENERSWRQHVYEDFPPYVCLDQHCKAATRQFGRRRDWRQHMSQHDHNEEDHIHTQITSPPTNTPIKCPLCEIEKPNLSTWYKHVGHHLEQLTLFALPSHLLDNDSDDEEEELRDLDVSESEEGSEAEAQAQDDESDEQGSIDSEQGVFDPSDIEASRATVTRYARSKRWESATELQLVVVEYWEAAPDHPERHLEALDMLAMLYMHQQRWRDARAVLLDLENVGYVTQITTNNLFVTEAYLDNYHNIIPSPERDWKIVPADIRAANSATIYYAQKRYDEAKFVMEELVNPNNNTSSTIVWVDQSREAFVKLVRSFIQKIDEVQASFKMIFPDKFFVFMPADLLAVANSSDTISESDELSSSLAVTEEVANTHDDDTTVTALMESQMELDTRMELSQQLEPSLVEKIMAFRAGFLSPFATSSEEYHEHNRKFRKCIDVLLKRLLRDDSLVIDYEDAEERDLYVRLHEICHELEKKEQDDMPEVATTTASGQDDATEGIQSEPKPPDDGPSEKRASQDEPYSQLEPSKSPQEVGLWDMYIEHEKLKFFDTSNAYDHVKRYLSDLMQQDQLERSVVDRALYMMAQAACRASAYTDVSDLCIGLSKQRRSQLNREDRHIDDSVLGIWKSLNEIVTIRQSLAVLDVRQVLVRGHVDAANAEAVIATKDLADCTLLAGRVGARAMDEAYQRSKAEPDAINTITYTLSRAGQALRWLQQLEQIPGTSMGKSILSPEDLDESGAIRDIGKLMQGLQGALSSQDTPEAKTQYEAQQKLISANGKRTKSDDAGNMFIQCDGCSVWQHGGSVGIFDERHVPDKYYCEQCRAEQQVSRIDERVSHEDLSAKKTTASASFADSTSKYPSLFRVSAQALSWLMDLNEHAEQTEDTHSSLKKYSSAVALDRILKMRAASSFAVVGNAINFNIQLKGRRRFECAMLESLNNQVILQQDYGSGIFVEGFTIYLDALLNSFGDHDAEVITFGQLVFDNHRLVNVLYEEFAVQSDAKPSSLDQLITEDERSQPLTPARGPQADDDSRRLEQEDSTELIYRDLSDDLVLTMLRDLSQIPASTIVDAHSWSQTMALNNRGLIEKFHTGLALTSYEYEFEFVIRCLGHGQFRLNIIRKQVQDKHAESAEKNWRYNYTTTELAQQYGQGERTLPVVCGLLNIARFVARIFSVQWVKDLPDLETQIEQSDRLKHRKGEDDDGSATGHDSDSDTIPSASSGPYAQTLEEYCKDAGLSTPSYKFVSGRSGGRTVWTCRVTILDKGRERSFEGDTLYDARSIGPAREDAARKAFQTLSQELNTQFLSSTGAKTNLREAIEAAARTTQRSERSNAYASLASEHDHRGRDILFDKGQQPIIPPKLEDSDSKLAMAEDDSNTYADSDVDLLTQYFQQPSLPSLRQRTYSSRRRRQSLSTDASSTDASSIGASSAHTKATTVSAGSIIVQGPNSRRRLYPSDREYDSYIRKMERQRREDDARAYQDGVGGMRDALTAKTIRDYTERSPDVTRNSHDGTQIVYAGTRVYVRPANEHMPAQIIIDPSSGPVTEHDASPRATRNDGSLDRDQEPTISPNNDSASLTHPSQDVLAGETAWTKFETKYEAQQKSIQQMAKGTKSAQDDGSIL